VRSRGFYPTPPGRYAAVVAADPIAAGAQPEELEQLLADAAALDASTLLFLRPRARHRPDLRLLAWRGERVVAKDWRATPLYLRPHARACLGREWNALVALAGLPDVPQPLARIPGAIVISHVDGAPLQHGRPPREQRDAFFTALAACVERIHARGVLHFDLRQRRNVLVGADGEPRVLDFEAALVVDPARPLGRLALALGGRVDRHALLKLKARYAPRLLAPAERRLARRLRILRWAWPSALLHRARVALRRLRRSARS